MFKLNYNSLFTSTSSLTTKEKKKKRKLQSRYIGISLVIIQIILSIMFLSALFHLNIIPDKYLIIIIVALLFITLLNLLLQYTRINALGKIMSILLSVVLLYGFLFTSKTTSTLNILTKPVTASTSEISIIVLATDPAQNVNDAQNYKFGYNSVIDKSNTDIVVTQINTQLEKAIDTADFSEWDALVNALYNQDVKAIILNESYRSAIEENFTDFDQRTRNINDPITIENQSAAIVAVTDKDISENPFSIYIAGNDQYGALAEAGRNDVNIIATFNPKTKQALLVTTPRDYYIMLDNLAGDKGLDKLTHAGNFGIQGSITALQNLYNINLDYYLKVNFTGAVGIVNALGGITIDSEVAFKASFKPISFVKGLNYCNGDQTLIFCRERYAFTNGDFQRGRDQMSAIKGIIAKSSSPAIISNYSAVLNSVSSLFETNMPTDAITAFIKDTLNDSASWNIQTYDVSGTCATKHCELFGSDRSVVIPDYNTVNAAIQFMNRIKNGETFQVK